jgi:putative AdoMet-dependent methyltransferase
MKDWYYNEFKQIGINFECMEEVQAYDEKFRKQRNIQQEILYVSGNIGLNSDRTILEIGTGTAELAIGLSKLYSKVIAVDVSGTMLSYAEKKISELNIGNIELKRAGFLNLDLESSSLDAVVSTLALHHLPDFWKTVALKNVYNVLKPGGKFLLTDCILSFDMNTYDESISGFLDIVRNKAGDKIANEIIVNIRDEYPTYNWIIEQMLKKAGFKVNNIIKYTELISSFVCEK